VARVRNAYPGFPVEGIEFLAGLAGNNNREWFQERKGLFDSTVMAPMRELVNAINDQLLEFAPQHVTDPRKAIYRIYRDTRFSADKTPYKTHIAASFPCRGLEKHAGAGYYFSVSAKEIEIAGGVYMPGPEQLLAIRTHLSAKLEDFRRLIGERRLQSLVGDLKGEQLSRVPKGFSKDDPAAGLLRHKQWYYYVLLDPSAATTPKLLFTVIDHFRTMKSVVDFLNQPLLARRAARPESTTPRALSARHSRP
jgi:uncharacterized protein (TIGR02453 family)